MSNLENVTIHQFRGLRDLELRDLGRINLLVGINNSGKTSVLEALSVYCHPLDIREWFSTALQRDAESRQDRIPPIDALKWLFTRYTELINPEINKPTILISSDGAYFIKQLKASYEQIEGISLSTNKRRSNSIDITDDEIDHDDATGLRKGIDFKIEVYTKQLHLFDNTPHFIETFQLWENEVLARPSRKREPGLSLCTSIVTPVSHRFESPFRLFSEARFKNFQADVLELLQKIDNNISDIEILLPPQSTSTFSIYIQHKKLGLAPVSTFGDGIRRLLHIALKLASAKGGILLIDELDSTIHTEALQNSFQWLVKWCTEMDVQLFATTHSLEAVDALLEVTESDSDLVLYRLEPKEGKTKVVRHDGHRLRRLREELGQEVRW
ncbi:AAA family ATPase [Aphanizomenon sp. PH219]|nr:AAA family ATPase [Aphanizomenon sp. 202]MDK2459576.1 AAA family ATPase [Aphanizomenon sp. PH219]